MPKHLVLTASLLLATAIPVRAAVVWPTGSKDVTFSLSSAADPALPANQDRIATAVWISRGLTNGIFNVAAEPSFTHLVSPAGTAWAFSGLNGNPVFDYGSGAPAFGSLAFADWETSLGGGGFLQTNILNRPAVLHLLADDIYLDLQFSAWGSRGNSAFTYQRAAAPTPVPEPASLLLVASGSSLLLRRRTTSRSPAQR